MASCTLLVGLLVLAVLAVVARGTSYENFDFESLQDGGLPLSYTNGEPMEFLDTNMLAEELIKVAKMLLHPVAEMTQNPELLTLRDMVMLQENLAAANVVVESNGDVDLDLASIDVGATPPIPFNPKSGLSKSCNNKLCTYIEKALTCKGMSTVMNHQCARYLVGALYHCSELPSNIYQAPSICLADYTSFISIVKPALNGNPQTTITALTRFLKNYAFPTNTCPRRCYQYYRQAALDFYSSCGTELKTYATTYPLVYAFGNFQDFRMQGCNTNSLNGNCYQNFANLTSAPPVLPGLNIMKFDCKKYLGDSTGFDAIVQAGICTQFKQKLGGCCSATAIQLAQQNQISAPAKITLFPPCLLGFFQSSSCNITLNELCTNHSIAPQAIITAHLYVAQNAVHLPNAFNNVSVLNTMGIISGTIASVNPAFAVAPYNFNKDYPFQVMMTGTNRTVGPYHVYPLQITMQNLNEQQLNTLAATLNSTKFAGYLSSAQAFGGNAAIHLASPEESLSLTPASLMYPNNAASSMSKMSMTLMGVLVALVSLVQMVVV